MKEVYIHTLRYHHDGARNKTSRIMYSISYGPFKDEDSAWEWVRRSGITHGTKLMSTPAAENVEVPHNPLSMKKGGKFNDSLRAPTQQSIGD